MLGHCAKFLEIFHFLLVLHLTPHRSTYTHTYTHCHACADTLIHVCTEIRSHPCCLGHALSSQLVPPKDKTESIPRKVLTEIPMVMNTFNLNQAKLWEGSWHLPSWKKLPFLFEGHKFLLIPPDLWCLPSGEDLAPSHCLNRSPVLISGRE